MPKGPVIPKDDDGKTPWLSNIAGKLNTYAGIVGVSPAEVTQVVQDKAFWEYVMDAKNKFANHAQDWTAYKNAARSGDALGNMPTPPALGAAPALVPPNIFGRIGALIVRIKKHPGYTDAIGNDLDIIGAEQTIDPSTMKPVLNLILQAGHPLVRWKKQGMDAIELQVDRGDGKGFVFLAIDTIPDYLDTADLPAAGASAVWKYRGIYRLADERVGQWSDVASISVMGA
jgi:hypothetical protein